MAGTTTQGIGLRALALIAMATALACALTLGAATPAHAAKANCPKQNATPNNASAKELSAAMLCLVNKERKKADVKPVDRNGDLTRVAEKHAKVMVEEDCLDHRCDGEASLKDRILRSGYLNRGGRYGYAENTGCATTPVAMVNAWMDKKFFRKNITGKRYEDVGIGPVKGSPDLDQCNRGDRKATYSVIFAWRSND